MGGTSPQRRRHAFARCFFGVILPACICTIVAVFSPLMGARTLCGWPPVDASRRRAWAACSAAQLHNAQEIAGSENPAPRIRAKTWKHAYVAVLYCGRPYSEAMTYTSRRLSGLTKQQAPLHHPPSSCNLYHVRFRRKAFPQWRTGPIPERPRDDGFITSA